MNMIDKIVESKDLRDELMENIDVLDKIKQLVVMPNTEVTTVKQVAKYYEVEIPTIERITERNEDELSVNGYRLYRQKEVINLLNQQSVSLNETIEIKPSRGKTEVIINDIKIIVPSRGLKLFSRRAVLNVGMLLTRSPIAEKVREYLLDSENKLDEEQKDEIISEITNEQLLQLNILNAKGENERMLALSRFIEFKDEKAEKYIAKVENLTTSNATFGIRDAKNNLGVGERKLVSYLLDNKYCYRQGGVGRVRPYSKFTNDTEGRFFTEIKVTKRGQDYTKIALTIDGIEFLRESIDEINSWGEI